MEKTTLEKSKESLQKGQIGLFDVFVQFDQLLNVIFDLITLFFWISF